MGAITAGVVAAGASVAASNKQAGAARNAADLAANQTSENRAFIARQTNQARTDAIERFQLASDTRRAGTQQAIDIFSQTIPQQMGAFQQGNVGAQQALARGLPQFQAAILGQPIDFGAFQPVTLGQQPAAQGQLPSAQPPVNQPAVGQPVAAQPPVGQAPTPAVGGGAPPSPFAQSSPITPFIGSFAPPVAGVPSGGVSSIPSRASLPDILDPRFTPVSHRSTEGESRFLEQQYKAGNIPFEQFINAQDPRNLALFAEHRIK